jgi:hypothetical protein
MAWIMTFHIIIYITIGNFIIPTDEVHHFSEGWRNTTNQNRLKQIEPVFLSDVFQTQNYGTSLGRGNGHPVVLPSFQIPETICTACADAVCGLTPIPYVEMAGRAKENLSGGC